MAALNDIPIVGNVVQRIEDAAVDSAILRLRYLLCYKTLIKALKTQVDKLLIEEDAISTKAVAERDDGKLIKEHVLKWQQDVENIKMVVQNLLERYQQRPSWMCFKDLPLAKPVSRFRLGKQAAEDTITVTQLTESGKEFLAHEIAHHPPKENVPISDTMYQTFQSRQQAYGKLWEALINEDTHPILGIYGMPGVGKTRMMEEAWKQAKEEGIFHKVTRANVGAEKTDVIKLQDQLAGYLDCHLESKDNEVNRSSQLKQSLMNGGKTLVILDDVWDVISLNQIGIPFGDDKSKGCKILFTSRRRDLCLSNNCEDPIEIKTLTEDEAWHMFKEAVGICKIESLQDTLLAEKVCRKCGRLPLLINAVGKAVKFVTENSWTDALYQLEDSRFEEIDGMEPQVYSCLQLSFEKLTEAGKACLLLCSLFPEDADIHIKELSNLATGSPLLDGRRNIAGVVDILKSSSLLLEGETNNAVKIHDIIRDVARSIAAKDPKYGFLSISCRLGCLDNIDCNSRRLLRLDLGKGNVCFPNDLVCPDLHTLWLQCESSYYDDNCYQKLSSGFCEGSTDLRYLLQGAKFPEQKLSIQTMEKLKILIIDDCHIDETLFRFVPQTLGSLCIKYCSLPSPLDLSNLKSLRKLELVVKEKEIKMVRNSISSLSRLEELNIPRGSIVWEDGVVDSMSIYGELNKLRRLQKLRIILPNSMSCLDGDIISNLLEFNIFVGFRWYDLGLLDTREKSISLKGNHIESGWMALVERAEEVYVSSVKGLWNDKRHSEAFANLKRLRIEQCDEMDHLGRLSVDGRNQPYLSYLCELTISRCKGLRYLFSATVANCLQNLQQLIVSECESIEEIVRDADHGEEVIIIRFPKLKELKMNALPRLKSFSTHNKVLFPSLEGLEISYLKEAREIWGKGNINYNQQQDSLSSFTQLKSLIVYQCDKLENVIPVSMDHDEFNNLQYVKIKRCKSLKSVFQLSSIATDMGNLNHAKHIVFSCLNYLSLLGLPSIERLWSCDGETVVKVSFLNLETFSVGDCKSGGLAEQVELGTDDDSPTKLSLMLNNNGQEAQIVPSQWLLQLQNLQSLYLHNCMWHGHSLFNTTTLIPNTLKTLSISGCNTIGPALFNISFFRTFQQLQNLSVADCLLLEEIVEEGDIGIDVEKMISLPSLYELELANLRGLKSFSQTSTYTFNMPALTYIILSKCPPMDKFTSFPINTPLLKINREAISDLNRYVREKVYDTTEEESDGEESYGEESDEEESDGEVG